MKIFDKFLCLTLLCCGFFISSLSLNAQCIACESYSDALKSPVEVRMLQLKNSKEALDERIGECVNLQVLFWESSGLQHLPDSFIRLQNLTDLSLTNNAFQEFPLVLLKLKKLKVLNLQGNSFNQAEKEHIRELVKKELPGAKLFI